jgi:hypothetical protein
MCWKRGMTEVESQYLEHKKESGEKNADSDWKPMCQAEVERVHKARNWLGANISSRRRRTERRRQDSD